ncbi:MAG: serine/threonine-protein kinase [Candidatus Eremiobacteraeota bacterium]|nr:serine/threonine-protein kinase [Candidatus Eremiobacteraeota bacterium]
MAAPLQPGTVVNSRYRITRFLGSGAFGAVYLGMDLREKGAVWALKEVLGEGMEPGEKREVLESFRNEAAILTALSHRGIPRFTDYFITGGRGYLVMERVEGLTLEDIVKNNKKPLNEREVAGWAIQLCDTLEYLHRHDPPIIFRDLKPQNIMLTMEERVVLIDFGISRFYCPGKDTDTIPLGTPGYSPPEQYGRSQTTPASDLYSLATTLYYLLTLQDMASFQFRYPPVRAFNSGVSQGMEHLLAKCMAWDTKERYQSAAQVRGILCELTGKPSENGSMKKYGVFLKEIRLESLFPFRREKR